MSAADATRTAIAALESERTAALRRHGEDVPYYRLALEHLQQALVALGVFA